MKFEISDKKLDTSIVCTISLNSNSKVGIKNSKLKNTNCKARENFMGLCVLPDDRLLCCYKNDVIVYDKNLSEIIKLEAKCWSFPVFNNDRIYFIETNYRIMSVSVIMTDLDFKIIKTLNFDKYLILNICSFKDCVYVSDYNNEKIQKLNNDLDFIKNYQLQLKPLRIELNDYVACIMSNTLINIHDARTFKSLRTFSNASTCIRDFGLAKINSWFLTYNQNGKYMCFDKQGNFFEDVEIQDEKDKLSGPLIVFNDKILLLNLTNGFFYH